MARRDPTLPPPRDNADRYLYDMAVSLRRMLDEDDDQASVEAPSAETQTVQLQEPQPSGKVSVTRTGRRGVYELVDSDGQKLEEVSGKRNAEQRARQLAPEAS